MVNKNHKGEQRFAEIRSVSDNDGKMILEGYAIVFNSPATYKYGEREFTEVILPDALTNCDMHDVPLRYNHNDTWLIAARTRNGSLQLNTDEHGLFIRAELIDTSQNRDIYKCVQSGLIDKMSFAFTVAPDGEDWKEDNKSALRTIKAIERLYDVSIVDVPFYDTTSVYARNAELLESGFAGLEKLELEKRRLLLKYKEAYYHGNQ